MPYLISTLVVVYTGYISLAMCKNGMTKLLHTKYKYVHRVQYSAVTCLHVYGHMHRVNVVRRSIHIVQVVAGT